MFLLPAFGQLKAGFLLKDFMATKNYVVLHGVLTTPGGDSFYKGAVVPAADLGDQVDRHIKNDAIREATPAEVRTGKADATDEPTLEQMIEDEKALIESSQLRIKQLEGQIKDRDAKLKAQTSKDAEKK